jgi:hypothetical protein
MGLAGVDQLAQAILINNRPVSRRTLYKWYDRGAPFTTEGALRAWVAGHGIPVAPAEPTLSDVVSGVLAQNALPTPAAQVVSAPAKTDADDKPTGGHSPAQLAALARRDRDQVQTEKAELELSILQRQHLHQSQAAAAVKDLAQETLVGLTDLVPRVLRGVPTTIDADLRQQMREALQKEILALRTHLIARAPQILRKALGMEGTTT